MPCRGKAAAGSPRAVFSAPQDPNATRHTLARLIRRQSARACAEARSASWQLRQLLIDRKIRAGRNPQSSVYFFGAHQFVKSNVGSDFDVPWFRETRVGEVGTRLRDRAPVMPDRRSSPGIRRKSPNGRNAPRIEPGRYVIASMDQQFAQAFFQVGILSTQTADADHGMVPFWKYPAVTPARGPKGVPALSNRICVSTRRDRYVLLKP